MSRSIACEVQDSFKVRPPPSPSILAILAGQGGRVAGWRNAAKGGPGGTTHGPDPGILFSSPLLSSPAPLLFSSPRGPSSPLLRFSPLLSSPLLSSPSLLSPPLLSCSSPLLFCKSAASSFLIGRLVDQPPPGSSPWVREIPPPLVEQIIEIPKVQTVERIQAVPVDRCIGLSTYISIYLYICT